MAEVGTHWHVAIKPTPGKRGAGGRDAVALDCDRDWIERRILDPRRRGERITVDGQTFTWAEVARLRITVSAEPSALIIQALKAEDRQSSVVIVGGRSYKERVPYAARDVTDELIDSPPGTLASGVIGEQAKSETDPRAVMVVHGRNEEARGAMFDFLRAIGLHPMEWGPS